MESFTSAFFYHICVFKSRTNNFKSKYIKLQYTPTKQFWNLPVPLQFYNMDGSTLRQRNLPEVSSNGPDHDINLKKDVQEPTLDAKSAIQQNTSGVTRSLPKSSVTSSENTKVLKVSYFKMFFWCHRLDQNTNENFSRISALASKKKLNQKNKVKSITC